MKSLFALAALTLALAAAPAYAGQVVYENGEDVWLMNDDGTAQRELIRSDHLPGVRELTAPTFGATPPGAPDELRIAFGGQQHNPTGSSYCGVNCFGIYVLDDGQVARVTNAPGGNCGGSCASFNEAPELGQASTRVVYRFSTAISSPPSFGQRLSTVTPGGSPQAIDTECDQPDEPTAHPQEDLFAYVCGSSLYTSGADPEAAADDVKIAEDDATLRTPSFSPDGTEIVEAEDGGEPGLWRVAADGSGFLHVLESPGDAGFTSPRYTNDGFVFVFEGDVWRVSNTCTAATCSFPEDATRLTQSGAVGGIGWTASTGQVRGTGTPPDGAGNGTPADGTTPGPAPGDPRPPSDGPRPPIDDPRRPEVVLGNPLVSASAKARRKAGRRMIHVDVRVSRAATVEVAVGRVVTRRRGGRRVQKVIAAGKRSFEVEAGSATLTLATVAGRRIRPGRYRLRIRAIADGTEHAPRPLTVRVR